jgi:ubiquinone/menaquinone biosynthesis C-methylase UbiE
MESSHSSLTPDRMYYFNRQRFVIGDFETQGCVLDIGGGGEGIIGRLKGSHVVSIDLRRDELEAAPPGPLKIVMDACALQFLDCSINTVTAFCTMLYLRTIDQEQVFREVYRVLTNGGHFLIWDFNLPESPDPAKDIAVFPVSIFLPDQEEIRAGYGTHWPEINYNSAYYISLAEKVGFKVTVKREDGYTFFLELQKR